MRNLQHRHLIGLLAVLLVARTAAGLIPFWKERPDHPYEIFKKLGYSFGPDVDRVSAVAEILREFLDKDQPQLILNKYSAKTLLALSEYEYNDCGDVILEKRVNLCKELSEENLAQNPHDILNYLLMDKDIYYHDKDHDHREPRSFMVHKNLHNYCLLSTRAYRKYCTSVNQPVSIPSKAPY